MLHFTNGVRQQAEAEVCVERDTIPPDVVVRRLPVYARSLRYLLAEGVRSISSQELGERINMTAAQIRKDLSYFGEFGKQGIGYDVERLLAQIEQILGLQHEWPVALVGLGQLGQAVARYDGFRSRGLHIVALFDNDPAKIGQEFEGITVQHTDEIAATVPARNIRVGIVAVPAVYAQEVANTLTSAGVRAILNYAPIVLQVPAGVWVREIDPVAVLHSMTFYLARDASLQRD